MGVVEPFPIVADAGLEAEVVELLVLDLVRLGLRAGWQCAKASPVLASAEAQVVVPPSAESHERAVGNIPLVDQRDRIAAHSHAIMEARSAVAVGVVIHSVRAFFQSQPARLAVGFVISRHIEIAAECPGGVEREGAAPGVQEKVTVRLPEALGLLVIVVAVIPEPPDRAAERGEVRIHVETSDDVGALDGERRVERGLFHHKIDRPGWLRAIHERRATTHDFHALDGIERRGVVGLGVANHVGMDRNPVLEDLEILGAVRIVAAIADAQERRVFLGEHQTGGFRDHLPVVVHADVGNLLEVDIRSFLARVDFCPLHIG